ncbi:MAG: hypothetical protein D6791_09505, partial [Chloroflexi bacterium]
MTEVAVDTVAEPAARRLSWKAFGVLMAGALVGILGVIPYSLTLSGPLPPLPIPLWPLLTRQVIQNLVLIAAATGLGLWLGGKVGLGAPLLRAWLAGDPEAPA